MIKHINNIKTKLTNQFSISIYNLMFIFINISIFFLLLKNYVDIKKDKIFNIFEISKTSTNTIENATNNKKEFNIITEQLNLQNTKINEIININNKEFEILNEYNLKMSKIIENLVIQNKTATIQLYSQNTSTLDSIIYYGALFLGVGMFIYLSYLGFNYYKLDTKITNLINYINNMNTSIQEQNTNLKTLVTNNEEAISNIIKTNNTTVLQSADVSTHMITTNIKTQAEMIQNNIKMNNTSIFGLNQKITTLTTEVNTTKTHIIELSNIISKLNTKLENMEMTLQKLNMLLIQPSTTILTHSDTATKITKAGVTLLVSVLTQDPSIILENSTELITDAAAPADIITMSSETTTTLNSKDIVPLKNTAQIDLTTSSDNYPYKKIGHNIFERLNNNTRNLNSK